MTSLCTLLKSGSDVLVQTFTVLVYRPLFLGYVRQLKGTGIMWKSDILFLKDASTFCENSKGEHAMVNMWTPQQKVQCVLWLAEKNLLREYNAVSVVHGYVDRKTRIKNMVYLTTLATMRKMDFLSSRKHLCSDLYVFPNSSHSCHYRRYRTYRHVLFRMNAVLASQLLCLLDYTPELRKCRKIEFSRLIS
ncbi:hypothetical protein ANN_26213 [Periplaneta americana]|uniref:Uncharacterized protein n=1 Tax=Periplaneta americana TaxID=6978 RepID=A0ABQ8S637_PERAM|nr:hypothetical protein ANN_26213 [Periplaneta americana]